MTPVRCDRLDPPLLGHMGMLDQSGVTGGGLDQSGVTGGGLDPYTNWDTCTGLVLDEAYCIKLCLLSRPLCNIDCPT